MAPKRNEKSLKAEEMYYTGEKLVNIARVLDVPASTVRRWKSTQRWSKGFKTNSPFGERPSCMNCPVYARVLELTIIISQECAGVITILRGYKHGKP